ncbi:MAG: sialidase family protein [Myxococcales bacterium]|nr:glycoside hydrolase [Myxococcales bacterium]
MRLLAAALLIAGCGDHAEQSFAGLTRVSAATPFAAGCAGQQGGTNYSDAEVEPRLAVDPLDPRHLVGVWQQDRWSNGGASGLMTGVTFDGGLTWTRTFVHYTLCGGGAFQRASDPWVSFAPDGTVHQIGYGFDNAGFKTAMLASRSIDGGRGWSEPITLYGEDTSDDTIDKESITADPHDAQTVYAVWDRLTGQDTPDSPANTGPAWFTRSTDAGLSWETARIIYDPGQNAQTISNQIVVLPNGALLDLLVIITNNNSTNRVETVAVLRSADKGVSWSQPTAIATMQSVGVVDPKQTSFFIRTGDVVPDIAVDGASGAVYAAWEDARFSNHAREGIAISRSADGGLSWSTPARVNGILTTQAFTPAVAVAQGGVVGVSYYDLREDDPGDNSQLLATRWLATSHDGGATFQDTAQSSTFDIRKAPQVVERLESGQVISGYFLGDYEGLVAVGSSFLPFFVIANNGDANNRTDVFARPIASTRAAASLVASSFVAPRRLRSGPRRIF